MAHPTHSGSTSYLLNAACVFILMGVPVSGAAAVLGAPPSQATATDRLVVRSRAGVHAQLRHQLLRAQGTEEVGHIDALGASVIRVPHGRWLAVGRALRRSGYFKSVEVEHFAAAAQTPNDPDVNDQWGLPKIGVPTAWNVTMGNAAIVVAIVDSGVDPTHPDLHTQLLQGYDFVNDDADPSDDNGHGTRMAGIVAAATFNGIGVAGIAPNCKLIPVKVLGADGQGAYSTIANGITYAADHGARIINLSLAGTADSATLQSAVDYAVARGAVVVAAAGNYGTGDPAYPAAYANAVAVTASDENDAIASFSNYGSWVSLAAPGVSIMTTNWNASGTFPYAGSSGTSPAAAFASGAFALLFSAHPEFSNSQAVSVLTGSAHDLGINGWDPYSGWGRVDIAAALGAQPVAAPTPIPTVSAPAGDRRAPSVTIISPAGNSLVWGATTIDVAATDDLGVTRVDLLVDNAVVASDTAQPFSFVWDASSAPTGMHTLKARAYDASGHRGTSKTTHVAVTRGIGLSVKRVRLSTPHNANRGATLSVTASFALPDGVALEQPQTPFSVALLSSKGPVLSTASQANALSADSHGRMRLTTSMANAGGGVLKVIVNRPKNQPTYNLTITATGLSAVNADTLMALNLNISGATLSQSLSFQSRNSGYLFP
jgi:thermitase